jgi:hypothetical protein
MESGIWIVLNRKETIDEVLPSWTDKCKTSSPLPQVVFVLFLLAVRSVARLETHQPADFQVPQFPTNSSTMATCVCVLQAEGSSGVSGSLKLSQNTEDGPTTIEGQIRGLTPGQKHGISVCVFGDLSNGGTSCGPSFNPFGM